jgi:group I intron endonuclease
MIKRTLHIPNTSGIYQIQSIVNDKRYIGSAFHLKQRKKVHFKVLKDGRHNRHFQNHYNKYGIEDLQFSIIEFCPKEKLIEREQYWIDRLQPEFNICKIAGLTYHPSFLYPEQRRKRHSDRMIKRWEDSKYKEKVVQSIQEWWSSLEGQEYIELDNIRKHIRNNRPSSKKRWKEIIKDPVILRKRIKKIIKTTSTSEYKERQRQATNLWWLDTEYRKKQKISRIGLIKSEENILHWKETYWKRPKRTCPYCGFKSRNGNLKKYHLKNCKYNPDRPMRRTKYPLIPCPYCDFKGKSISAMKHWHFDNCRYKT